MKWGSKDILNIQYGNKEILAAYWGSKKIWENTTEDINEKYLTIESLEDDFYIMYWDALREPGYNEDEIQELCVERGWEYEKMQYSFDKTNWYILEPNEESPHINRGEKIYLKRRCIVPELSNGDALYGMMIDKPYNLSGNCNSILFGDEEYGELFVGCFCGLFYNTRVVNISKNFLPSTTLAIGCYSNMFQNCSSLVTAPELPATSLEIGCYYEMFYGCTSLVTAPELPATILNPVCYCEMFYGCISLTNAPELPSTILADSCYLGMFCGCISLVTAPELPATTLANYCYSGMFDSCISLVTAPELPSTTLAEGCYDYMFANCTSLVTAPELPATTLAEGCYSSMFYECHSLVTAPELPATTLVDYCYSQMFINCYKLNYIKMLATDINAYSCLYIWVEGVSPTGTFVKSKDATWDVTGNDGIPEGWTIIVDEVEVPDEENKILINFSIDESIYQAKEGMTWEEWINSEYNYSNGLNSSMFHLMNDNVFDAFHESLVYDRSNHLLVYKSDIIKSECKYGTGLD